MIFGVLVIGGEYTSGTIRASLAAVPGRGLFYGGKVLACALVTMIVSAVTVIVTFYAAQVGLGPHRVSLGSADVPQAMAGAWLYLARRANRDSPAPTARGLAWP